MSQTITAVIEVPASMIQTLDCSKGDWLEVRMKLLFVGPSVLPGRALVVVQLNNGDVARALLSTTPRVEPVR